jgi:hypothetical protein
VPGEVTLGPPERTGAARWRVWPYYAGDPSRFDRSVSAAAAAARHQRPTVPPQPSARDVLVLAQIVDLVRRDRRGCDERR